MNDKNLKRKQIIDDLLKSNPTFKQRVINIFKPFRILKDMFWNPLGFLMLFAAFGVFLIAYFHTPPKKYTGTVISVSSWDGDAELKTKTEFGKDTILNVHCRKGENFEVGQVITVWTGGDLFDGIASTDPQH